MNSSGNGSAHAVDPGVEEPLDLSLLDPILEDFRGRKGTVIPVLQRAQDAYGYLPREVLKAISQKMLIPLNHLYGVATFYAQFRLQRRGRHLIRICDGTACHVRGSGKSIEAIERSLRVAPGETTMDYRYTLEIVYCLGSCGLSPVAVVDDRVHARLTPETLVQHLESLE
jgi:NADH-quinone oxidoreductase subunit E